MEDDIDEGTVHVHAAVVNKEPQLPDLIQKATDACPVVPPLKRPSAALDLNVATDHLD